jgi:hypothetical protein
MNELSSKTNKQTPIQPQRLFNRNFNRFLFSFIAVIASVLFFILVIGMSNGI